MNIDLLTVLGTLTAWKRDLVLGSMVEGIDPTSLPWCDSDIELLVPIWNALSALDEVGQYAVFRRSFET